MWINIIVYNLVILSVKLTIISSFEVYWNIPTFMCRKHNILFNNSVPSFGIKQNQNDNFQGGTISIMYDPGMFPALGNNLERRNGGVPQEGDLARHLNEYKIAVNDLIPDKNNNGLVIIDFESWRPIYRQNFGSLSPYKDVSLQIERERHPFWTKSRQQQEAEHRFEVAGQTFVEETIILSKKLRPNAKWGYYAFPYCFNKNTDECPSEVKEENNRMIWMFKNSDLILPSVYLQEQKMKSAERQRMVKARIQEAMRIAKIYTKTTYVYIRYVYIDTKNFLSESDLYMVFQMAKKFNAHGIILWGSSKDLSSRKQCEKLQSYIDTTIGPIAQSFSSLRVHVDVIN